MITWGIIWRVHNPALLLYWFQWPYHIRGCTILFFYCIGRWLPVASRHDDEVSTILKIHRWVPISVTVPIPSLMPGNSFYKTGWVEWRPPGHKAARLVKLDHPQAGIITYFHQVFARSRFVHGKTKAWLQWNRYPADLMSVSGRAFDHGERWKEKNVGNLKRFYAWTIISHTWFCIPNEW